MSSKHRAGERPSAPHVALLAAIAAAILVVGYLLILGPLGPSPTAASENVPTDNAPATAERAAQGVERLVVYGHSMPSGGGASDVALSYPEVAAAVLGMELVNRSQGGSSAVVAANLMAAAPTAGPQDTVVIHTGMNDIFRRGDEAVVQGREGIERLLSGTSRAAQRVLVLECQPHSWLDTPPQRDLQSAYDAWNAMLLDEATIWPKVEVLDTCATWDPMVSTTPPHYHPNDAGHALIAAELAALLQGS